MSRAPRLVAAALAALLAAPPAFAQTGRPPAPPEPRAQASAQPPHAWLFGTWTGGFFAVPPGMPPQVCLAQPVVIFTRDLVLRATLTDTTMVQREIETVRAVPGGLEFRFTGNQTGGLLAQQSAEIPGFGCENADILHVQRRGENEISFPGCADFPEPLVRCQTR